MGGTFMLAVPIIGAVAIAMLVVVALAAVAFIGATVVSIVFAARTGKRRAQGKKLKGLIAIPIVLYAVSVPVLAWFAVVIAFPIIDADLTIRYDDCSEAIVTHDPIELRECLQTLTDPLPVEGEGSWEELLRVSIEYGDDECVRIVFDEADAQGAPLDVDAPLPSYDSEGVAGDAEPPLLLALGFCYSSPDMIRVLLDEGADPNIAAAAADGIHASELSEGETPLHLACRGVAGASVYVDDDEQDALQVLGETDEVVDLLLAYGADPAIEDAEGRTSWDNYVARVARFVQYDDLSGDEADRILESRAEVLR